MVFLERRVSCSCENGGRDVRKARAGSSLCRRGTYEGMAVEMLNVEMVWPPAGQ